MAMTAVLACPAPSAMAACGARADPKLIQRPADYKPNYPQTQQAVSDGEAVFKDTHLSSNGLSCASCHAQGQSYQASFKKPYPHPVAMAADTYGLKSVQLDEVIQMCMLGPMASKPLAWNSSQLAKLVAFISSEQKIFMKR